MNKRRVERLDREGLMTDAGRAVVEAARRNGAWASLDEVEELREPDDLEDALDAMPDARRHWDAFPRSTRRAILEWINAAKTNATREKRVGETVEKAGENIRANQWRQPKAR
ncbi:hypothetical protein GCM10009747_25720 [Agromyces humatus]|uniref:Uncharacterized protein n=1 Tax=Agromyces humatus TaxID=279573 RepID=A0ABN2KT12_9MICO